MTDLALEHVPSVRELVARGLAQPTTGNDPAFVVSAEGHRIMGAALLRNGLRRREHDAAMREADCPVPPASVTPPPSISAELR